MSVRALATIPAAVILAALAFVGLVVMAAAATVVAIVVMLLPRRTHDEVDDGERTEFAPAA